MQIETMNKNSSINFMMTGRLSLGIIIVGLLYLLLMINQEGYNGLDGTHTKERLFLSLISIGGIMGSISYAKKKTACSALSGIIFVMVMISAGTMYFNKPSCQQIEPVVTAPVESGNVEDSVGHASRSAEKK